MRFLLALSLLAMSAGISAADRWYEIEVIVFAHKDPALTSEQWPVLPSEPDLERAVIAPNTIVIPTLPLSPLGTTARELLRVASVPSNQYKLAEAFKSLNRSRLYQPVIHTAWRQPVSSGKEQLKVRIAGGKDFSGVYGIDGQRLDTGSPPALSGLFEYDGYVSFQSKNLLFATVDMMHRKQEMVPVTNGANSTGNSGSNLILQTAPLQESAPVATEDKVQFYRMSQHRRVRSSEVQYFDHPVFGVLIEMRPLEPGLEEQLEDLTN